jgi:hypothetical protein
MAISKSDFNDWLSNSVTKAYFSAITERIEEAKDVLAESAGLDGIQDNFYRGFIYAYRELKTFKLEDVEGAE